MAVKDMTDSLLRKPRPGFDAPIAMLLECHQRMRRQLASLERLQRYLPEHGADNEASQAARSLLKYFDTAAPQHHADEDESVFPRLRAAAPGRFDAALDQLHDDHIQLAELWRRLRPDLAAVAAAQRSVLTPDLTRSIAAAYLTHLEREEAGVLLQAAETLSTEALATIGSEMALRRDLR